MAASQGDMAKLINILAVSLGGGLVLGAGIRALEGGRHQNTAATDAPDPIVPRGQRHLLARIDDLEARLSRIEPSVSTAGAVQSTGAAFVASVYARLDAQDAEADAVLSRLARVETKGKPTGTGNAPGDVDLQTRARGNSESRMAGPEPAQAESRQKGETLPRRRWNLFG